MELKPAHRRQHLQVHRRLNRTFMELKQMWTGLGAEAYQSLNRTFMELKLEVGVKWRNGKRS